MFTDHLSKYPEFVSQEQLVPLDDTLTKDGFNADQYQEGLADLWVGQDGKRYGLPKDFDTVAVFYNKKLIADAGVKEADLQNLTWNPDDGGTYEKMIAHLTVDQNGKRGDEPASTRPRSRSTASASTAARAAADGQTQWSMYTGLAQLAVHRQEPVGHPLQLRPARLPGDHRLVRRLIDKGYMPSVAAVTGQGRADIFAAGKYAMVTNGSWSDRHAASAPRASRPASRRPRSARAASAPACTTAWRTPSGSARRTSRPPPSGSSSSARPTARTSSARRASSSRPSRPATDKAEAAFKAKGVDVTSFLVHVKDKTTFLFPITDHASQINGIMHPAMDEVLSGKAPVDIADRRQQPGQSAVPDKALVALRASVTRAVAQARGVIRDKCSRTTPLRHACRR